MSTCVNFNLLGNVSHRKQTNQRRISDPKIIYDGALSDNIMSRSHFVFTKQLQLRWCRNLRGAFVSNIFSSNDNSGRMGEEKDPKDWNISLTGTFSFLGERNIIYCFLCWETFSFIYPFAFCCFYDVLFESLCVIWKYLNEL